MKKGLIAILCVVFSFMVCFLGIGYASISRSLIVQTSLSAHPPTGIFISNVTIPAGVNAKTHIITGARLKSTIDLGAQSNATASLQITVFNNSSAEYLFKEVAYMVGEETYDNKNIVFSLSGLSAGQSLKGGESITFTMTFSYASDTVTDTELTSLLHFSFFISGAIGRFAEVLNSDASYSKLINQMALSSNRADTTYIGNVKGANGTDDATVLNGLFTINGTNLMKLPINGQETEISAIVKKENVDNNTATGDNGAEMTIYMTPTTSFDGLPWYEGSLPVYAAVFTKNSADGSWYQLGETFEGKASSNNYAGGWGTNSFDTDSWTSSAIYYNLATGATIQELIAAIPKA